MFDSSEEKENYSPCNNNSNSNGFTNLRGSFQTMNKVSHEKVTVPLFRVQHCIHSSWFLMI